MRKLGNWKGIKGVWSRIDLPINSKTKIQVLILAFKALYNLS